MKQLTKNLITYQADIHASPLEIASRIPHFTECLPSQKTSFGFVPPIAEEPENLIVQVPGGWVLRLREDVKSVPASEVNKLVEEKVAKIKEFEGRTPGKRERKELKAFALDDLMPRAFAKRTDTFIVYSTAKQRVYVATGSQRTADTAISALVHALASVKTSTVHVSEPKMGLTARLLNWLNEKGDDETFGPLHPHGAMVMAGNGSKWSVKADSLRSAEATLREAIDRGTSVDSIGFQDADSVSFRVNAKFRILGVKHQVVDTEDDMSEHHAFVSQAASEIVTLDGIVDTLLDLLSPEKAQAETGADLFAEA